MLTVGQEPYGDWFWKEALPLLHEEWDVVGPPGEKLQVRYSAYDSVAAQGGLFLFTLRDGTALAGYVLIFALDDLHQSIPTMMLDALYVGRAWQGRRGGLRLLREVERVAKRKGVKRVVLTASALECGEAACRLYKLMGYSPVTLAFAKEL